MMAVRHPHARIDRRNAMAIGRCTMEWVRCSVLLHWNFLDARDSNRSMRKAPFSVDVHFFELRTPYTCDDEFREFIIDTYINFQLNNVFQRTYTYPNLYFWRSTERSLARITPIAPNTILQCKWRIIPDSDSARSRLATRAPWLLCRPLNFLWIS